MASFIRRTRRASGALRRLALPLLLLAAASGPAHAQYPRKQFWVPNGTVEDLKIANGAVYLAGNFTQVGPATGSFVGFDMTTAAAVPQIPEVVGTVRAVVSDGANGWYVGGYFSSVQNRPRSNLAQVDAAGNVTDWNPGANGNIFCMVRDAATGIVYVGGGFSTVGGQSRTGIAAIDADGVVTGWTPGPVGTINALALYGGTLYAGGNFASAGGQTRHNAAAFDAATGALLAWNPDADTSVHALATFLSTGFPSTLTVYLGGTFSTVGGAGRAYLAAVDGTTGAVTSWNPSANGVVSTIALAGGSNPLTNPLRIYVGGGFQFIGATPRSRIAEINEGGVPTTWNPGADEWVHVLRTAGNLLYVGGYFTTIGGQPIRHLAAVDRSTGAATSWDPLVGGRVLALGTTASAVFAGGEFWTAGGVRRNRLAALDLGTGLANAWNPNADARVWALAVTDTTVYAGGEFTSVGGQTRYHVAAVDPVSGAPTAWNPGANGTVRALDLGFGVVYVGGYFSTIALEYRSGLAAIDVATGLATGWDPAPSNGVIAIRAHGGRVYVGGDFTSIGGQSRNHFAALDRNVGFATYWNPYPEPDPNLFDILSIEDIEVSGSNVFVGGIFGRMGGRERTGFAVVDSLTAMANHWDHYASDAVWSLALDAQAVYVGGSFQMMDTQSRNGIAVMDATTGLLSPWNPRVGGGANALEVHQGVVYVGGFFQSTHASFAVFSDLVTGVATAESVPPARAARAAPNPFQSDVAFTFSLPRAGVFDVVVYDVAGRLIRRLERGPRAAGEHRVRWDGRDEAGRSAASGVYLARAESGDVRLSAKVLKVD